MKVKYPISIPGSPSTNRWADVTSPYSGEVVGKVEMANDINAEDALQKAYDLYKDKTQWLTGEEKIAIFEKTAKLIRNSFDELVDTALSEGGKPLVDTRVEVNRAIDSIQNCIDCIRTNAGKEIPMGINKASMGRLAVTHHEPIGVVLAISAFNHPLNLIVHQVGPAIAAGCPVIVKPAKDTALSCFKFVELLREAGLPENFCIPILPESHDITGKLVGDSRVSFLSFIGSAELGWNLRRKLAAGARCALEHGGVAPVIVESDAELDKTIPAIAKGGFYHAGQVCVSVQRVFVHDSIAKEFVSGLAEVTNKLVVGDPANETTEVGPLIRPEETDRIEAWVNEAIEGGAQLITGGGKISDVLYHPTVLLNPSTDAKVSTSEVFGPVVCVYTYENLDSAIEQSNGLNVVFQAAVFTQDIDKAMYIQRNLDAATVMVNDHTAFRVDWMPFAGLKESGHGVGGIPYTFEEMQVCKLLVINSKGLLR